MTQSIITVDNVSKSYGGVKANVDISMTVKSGSITGIIGPNGCGKSTLLRILAGLEDASVGSILIDGDDVTDRLPSERGSLSMVIACAGHTASHNLQAMHRSSPLG